MTNDISNIELIKLAVAVVNPIEMDGHWQGDVGCALLSGEGNIYRGVCIDAGSGVGFCAERVAIAQMFAHKEYKVKKIVAVWNNNPSKDVYVLPPCGACRHFMSSTLPDGLQVDVVLGGEKTIKLKELYPYHEWPTEKINLVS